MNDTLEPTAERLRRTFHAVADQVVDAPPAFHEPLLRDTSTGDGIVADIHGLRRDRRSTQRRWLIAAAAVVAAVLVVAGTVLVADGGHHAIRTKPAGPSPTPTTVPTTPTTMTIPTTVPGDDSTTGPL